MSVFRPSHPGHDNEHHQILRPVPTLVRQGWFGFPGAPTCGDSGISRAVAWCRRRHWDQCRMWSWVLVAGPVARASNRRRISLRVYPIMPSGVGVRSRSAAVTTARMSPARLMAHRPPGPGFCRQGHGTTVLPPAISRQFRGRLWAVFHGRGQARAPGDEISAENAC